MVGMACKQPVIRDHSDKGSKGSYKYLNAFGNET